MLRAKTSICEESGTSTERLYKGATCDEIVRGREVRSRPDEKLLLGGVEPQRVLLPALDSLSLLRGLLPGRLPVLPHVWLLSGSLESLLLLLRVWEHGIE